MITQEEIDKQVENINSLKKKLDGKQGELKNAINNLNFNELKKIKDLMNSMDVKNPESIMKAHKLMGEEMEKLFKNK